MKTGVYGYSGGELAWELVHYSEGPIAGAVKIKTTQAMDIGGQSWWSDALFVFGWSGEMMPVPAVSLACEYPEQLQNAMTMLASVVYETQERGSRIPHVWDDPMKGAFDAPFKVKVTLFNGETTMQTLYCFNRSDAERIIEEYNTRSIWASYELAPEPGVS